MLGMIKNQEEMIKNHGKLHHKFSDRMNDQHNALIQMQDEQRNMKYK